MKIGILVAIIAGSVAVAVAGTFFILGLIGDSRHPIVNVEKDVNEVFDNIKVDVETSNISFVLAEDNNTKLICSERDNYYHEPKVVNGTLEIRTVDKRYWFEKFFNRNMGSLTVR